MTHSVRQIFQLRGSLFRQTSLILGLISSSFTSTSFAAEPLKYNQDVRPILAEFCFACHGPDSASRKGDLRLDQRDAAITAGAILPNDATKSKLIERICSNDPDAVMPPTATKKVMTEAQKKILIDWINQGAEYQLHWSLIAPTKPKVPEAHAEYRDWVKNPIDLFVQDKLHQSGFRHPSAEADRYRLARRVALDLTGLPPDVALVDAFVADTSPNAYERLVDALLASESWGEHRARYWLDAARYGDSHGIHFDNYREMWSYRDWVIEAFNQNMPFDQFTIEQLAGDLLPDRTLQQQIASGFVRCNITTSEGGAIDEEYRVLYARDRTETMATVWMGLSAGCAVCHDHKFDPLTMRDFYSMSAFFNNTTQAAMDGNIKDTPPTIQVPLKQDRDRWQAVTRELAGLKAAQQKHREVARADYQNWVSRPEAGEAIQKAVSGEGLKLQVPLTEGSGKDVSATVNGQSKMVSAPADLNWGAGTLASSAVVLSPKDNLRIADVGNFDSNQSFTCSVWIKIPRSSEQVSAIVAHMDDTAMHRGWDFWFENGKIGSHIIDSWPENALQVMTRDPVVRSDQWQFITLTYDGSQKGAGVRVYVDGVSQPVVTRLDKLNGSTVTPVELTLGRRHAYSMLQDVSLQDVRLYDRVLSEPEVAQLMASTRAAAAFQVAADKRTPAQDQSIYDWWLNNQDAAFIKYRTEISQLSGELSAIVARGTVAHVMQERSDPATAFVLFRGEYDKRRDQVTPDTPKVMPPLPPDEPRTRLGLAKWLLSSSHPLTARVTVNRAWQELFGSGIVKTSSDFGVTGDLPSHPELLDWLALEFRDNHWNVKQLYKLMVMSATYRQSAVASRESLEKDPQNRYLSRGPRFRMDAEMVRDYALNACGLQSKKIGGPSVKPYQPDGVWEAVAMIGSNTRDYVRDSGESLYRRSLYTFWKRSAPPASMEIFNAPSRESCTIRRERTNTPLQALVTMNDVQFVEAARHLGQTALANPDLSVDQRLTLIGRRTVCRPWNDQELSILRTSIQDLLQYYDGHPEDAQKLVKFGDSVADPKLSVGTLAAWTMLINEVLNMDEVLNK